LLLCMPLMFAACAGASDPTGGSTGPDNSTAAAAEDSLMIDPTNEASDITLGHRAHILPVRNQSRQRAAAPSSSLQLKYYGGPVISNVKVWTIFWNAKTQYQQQLNDFYSGITQSAYFDWLSEYNTPTQKIGRGSLGGSVVDPKPPTKTTI